MLGARDNAANNNACCVFEFLDVLIDLQFGLSVTVYDSVVEAATSGEIGGRRGVSSMSCGISSAV